MKPPEFIDRSKAEQLITDIRQRIFVVNTNRHFASKVTQAAIYGIYASDPDSQRIPSLDLALVIETKFPKDSQIFIESTMHRPDLWKDDAEVLSATEVMKFVKYSNIYINPVRLMTGEIQFPENSIQLDLRDHIGFGVYGNEMKWKVAS